MPAATGKRYMCEKCGAEVIVTTTFTTRRLRLKENGIEEKFEELNLTACKLAKKAKELFQEVATHNFNGLNYTFVRNKAIKEIEKG